MQRFLGCFCFFKTHIIYLFKVQTSHPSLDMASKISTPRQGKAITLRPSSMGPTTHPESKKETTLTQGENQTRPRQKTTGKPLAASQINKITKETPFIFQKVGYNLEVLFYPFVGLVGVYNGLKMAMNLVHSLQHTNCTVSFQNFWHPGWYCNIKWLYISYKILSPYQEGFQNFWNTTEGVVNFMWNKEKVLTSAYLTRSRVSSLLRQISVLSLKKLKLFFSKETLYSIFFRSSTSNQTLRPTEGADSGGPARMVRR